MLANKSKEDLLFVGVQVFFFIIFCFDFFIIKWFILPPILNYTFLLFSALGIGIILIAILQLNKNLSPFPSPKQGSLLVQTGLFKLVRHPVYTGIIVFTINYSLWKLSPWKLVIAIALWVLFYFKSKYEEKQLAAKFESYNFYLKHTGRFFPKMTI